MGGIKDQGDKQEDWTWWTKSWRENIRRELKILILSKSQYTTNLVKLIDKMCQYEMDLVSIVRDREQTLSHPKTDIRTYRVRPLQSPSTALGRGT